ncbi:phenylacetic acid catabolism protein [Domibacillus antri]|uniref:Phenylacetic acid catabolism protein n=1 Tax=Domibacillus antri TaxID=1714264 RepID=A0A1Q8Q1R1_9BACI|nr:Phenylacetic acid catabolic protein [Domibacillus antri]OLN21274.1 phenylacetic acid catabolism protein [Domibacillus antri]
MAEMKTGLAQFTNVVEKIADNKYLLGDRLVEIGVSGPRLESTLSAIAMAQGELGHARLLYSWALDLSGFSGKKPEIESQTGKAFQFIEQVDDWVSLIAALYTVNASVDIVLNAVLKAENTDIVSRIQKLIREQKEHMMYTEGWIRQLREDSKPVQQKLQQYLDAYTLEAAEWLESLDADKTLQEGGYLSNDSALAEQLSQRLQKTAVLN